MEIGVSPAYFINEDEIRKVKKRIEDLEKQVSQLEEEANK